MRSSYTFVATGKFVRRCLSRDSLPKAITITYTVRGAFDDYTV